MASVGVKAAIARELQPRHLLPGLFSGLIAAVLTIVLQISFAALIFSGDLTPFLAQGIGLTLFAAFVVGLIVALLTSLPGVIGIPQDTPAAVLAVMTGAMAGTLARAAGEGSAEVLFVTVVAAIALSSLLSGAVFLLLGIFKKGSLVRYIPYPVIGGFLAGTGWLLLSGGLTVVTAVPFGFAELGIYTEAAVALLWLPAVVFAVVLLLLLRRWQHFLIMPGMILGAMFVFYVVLVLSGLSAEEARASGWLLDPVASEAIWRPLGPAELAMVDWGVIFEQAGSILTIVIVSTVSMLLYTTGLELVAGRDLDLDRELRTAGVANVAAGVAATGPTAFQTPSLSALNFRAGAACRLPGLFAAVLCGLALFFGAGLIGYFPKFVLGGLLIFLGLSFLTEWLVDAAGKLSRTDFLIVIAILVAMNGIGVLEGVGLGLALAVVLFVADYSQLGPVRRTLTTASHQSNVDRPAIHEKVLEAQGSGSHILQLQGYLFFGTGYNLLERVRAHLANGKKGGGPPLRHVVLDFKHVHGMDTSAGFGFAKLLQLAEREDFTIVFAQMPERLKAQLTQDRFGIGLSGDQWRSFPDLDRAVEWCEEAILADAQPADFTDWQEAIEQARAFMELQSVEAGQALIVQDDPPKGIFFIQKGKVSIQYRTESGKVIRLRTKGAGTVVGEMGHYADIPASASVVAETQSLVLFLSVEGMRRMESEDGNTAIAFHREIARQLSERLLATVRAMEAHLD